MHILFYDDDVSWFLYYSSVSFTHKKTLHLWIKRENYFVLCSYKACMYGLTIKTEIKTSFFLISPFLCQNSWRKDQHTLSRQGRQVKGCEVMINLFCLVCRVKIQPEKKEVSQCDIKPYAQDNNKPLLLTSRHTHVTIRFFCPAALLTVNNQAACLNFF